MQQGAAEASDGSRAVDFSEARIDALLRAQVRDDEPGMAVGIALGGEILYRKGFGVASVELPMPLSCGTRIGIHSTTKHFTCLAYLLLCEEGRAHPDTPIGSVLPELHPSAREVTARQLMGNTSGLRDAHDILWQLSGIGQRIAAADILAFYRDLPDVNFVRGTSWCYNNGGFLLLSALIERLADQSFEEVLQGRIFARCGMTNSLLRRFDTDMVPNCASTHVLLPSGGYQRSFLGTDVAGAGGIVSTVDDMLRWLAHMEHPQVGTSQTWRDMTTPCVLPNGTSTGYGFGLFRGVFRGIEILHHAGSTLGASSQMLKVPALGLDVVVLTNRGDLSASLITQQILSACIPSLPAPVVAANRQTVSGMFRSTRSGRVLRLLVREGRQICSSGAGSGVPMEADAEGVLRPAEGSDVLRESVMLLGSPENPSALRFTSFGNTDELQRLPEAQTHGAEVTGCFRSPATGTEVTVQRGDRGLQMKTVGRFGTVTYDMEALAERTWQCRSPSAAFLGGIVHFDADAQRFCFSNYSSPVLPFVRSR